VAQDTQSVKQFKNSTVRKRKNLGANMRASSPTTWDEASLDALEYITNIVSTVRFEEPVWKKYNAILDSLASFVGWREAASEPQAVSVMVDAGCMAMHSLVSITLGMDKTEMHKLLCRKQHDYGHGNISKFGLVVWLCVCATKLSVHKTCLKRTVYLRKPQNR
jgi:hypothetical protein